MFKPGLMSLSIFVAAALFSGVSGAQTYSGNAAKESGQASRHAVGSAANSIVASGQVTSAAAAVPLSVGAAVVISGGVASAAAAKGSMRAATAPAGKPLQITDEAITTIPPDKALKTKTGDKNTRL